MPARHKHSRLAARRERRSSPKFGKLVFLLPLIVVLGIAIFLLFFLTSIGGLRRVSLVTPDGNGDIRFALFDFKEGTLSSVVIPGTAEVSVARNLGTWRLGAVWKLGQNEKVGGVLLAETVTKALKLPADYWGDASYADLSSDNLGRIIRAIFSFQPTNLTLADRVKLGLFAFQAKITDRREIALADTNYLFKAKLTDGTLGYRLRGNDLPFELQAILADADISRENATILLENASGQNSIAADISALVDVLGGKIASVAKLDTAGIGCTVYGNAKLITYQTIAKVFACSQAGALANYNFDVVLRVGSEFARRF